MLRMFDDVVYLFVQPLSELIERATSMSYLAQAKLIAITTVVFSAVPIWNRWVKTHDGDSIVILGLACFLIGLLYIAVEMVGQVNKQLGERHLNFFRVEDSFMVFRLVLLTASGLMTFHPYDRITWFLFGLSLTFYLLGCQALPPGHRQRKLVRQTVRES